MKLNHLTLVAALSAAPCFAATPVYDSTGFESPKFTTGSLDGQDNGLWIESGGGTAGTASVVNTTGNVAADGAQAVAVSRTDTAPNGGDKRYWPATPVLTPSAMQNVVTVTWDMDVAANTTAGVSTGPFFGIEAYDPSVNLIAAAGVDATTGEVLFADSAFGGGFNNTTTDSTVALGSWNHFALSMNFTTGTAAISVNGVLRQVTAFDTTGVTQFSDADLSTVATDIEPVAQTGVALFDNYSVVNTAVPEPAGALCALIGSSTLLGRRRK